MDFIIVIYLGQMAAISSWETGTEVRQLTPFILQQLLIEAS